jgi:hypothetical protein
MCYKKIRILLKHIISDPISTAWGNRLHPLLSIPHAVCERVLSRLPELLISHEHDDDWIVDDSDGMSPWLFILKHERRVGTLKHVENFGTKRLLTPLARSFRVGLRVRAELNMLACACLGRGGGGLGSSIALKTYDPRHR